MRPLTRQNARRVARNELQFFHGKAHPVGFFQIDWRCPIEDAAHCGNRNLRLLGNISDGGRAVPSGHCFKTKVFLILFFNPGDDDALDKETLRQRK